MNKLFYGDNLDILRRKIKDETVDLCYIDPPFNSKRNYNQIYNRVGKEDRAQAHAFIDTWIWDDHAILGYGEILANDAGRFQRQLIELIKGLHAVLGEGSLLAYLVSMALRITEIYRVLKRTGSFYLHCDPTASHYLKLILDAIFCSQGGDFQNEIIWGYRRYTATANRFQRLHDVIFFFTKTDNFIFNGMRIPYGELSGKKDSHYKQDEDGRWYRWQKRRAAQAYKIYLSEGVRLGDWWEIPFINASAKERLGYPTQKPEALLERIVSVCSNEGDIVLDAYCGCGTTIAVAQRLNRNWIGMDITYQSISLVLRRLEHSFGEATLANVATDGIPQDMKSACALAHKHDDRLRKEFEKWAVLAYTNNRAIINERKGADAGIDACAFFMTGKQDNAKIIFQVKSGGVKRSDIATLRGDMGREEAVMAVLVTLENPSQPMIDEAKKAGHYEHVIMGRSYDKISIATVREIVEEGRRLEIPMSIEVLAAAKRAASSEQMELV